MTTQAPLIPSGWLARARDARVSELPMPRQRRRSDLRRELIPVAQFFLGGTHFPHLLWFPKWLTCILRPPFLSYTVSDLGTLGGASAGANAINEAGQAGGESWVLNNVTTHACLWDTDGSVIDLGVLKVGDWSTATALNDSGQAVGYSGTGPETRLVGPFHAFQWSAGVLTDLATLPGDTSSWAWGINNTGSVVGTSAPTSQHPVQWRPFVYKSGQMEPVGCTTQMSGGLSHAYSYDGAVFTDLGAAGQESEARRVSSIGRIVGYAGPEAFYRDLGAQLTDLGSLGGDFATARDVNGWGDMIGWSESTPLPSGNTEHAFITRGCWMFDLNDLIPTDSGWELLYAFGINNAGQIVGWGLP